MVDDFEGASGSAGDFSVGDTSISLSSDDIARGTTPGFGTSFADDAQATVDSSNVLSQASFNEASGITIKNPFGNQGFFTRVFGIPPEYLDYRGGNIDTVGIANLAYDRYRNPLTSEGKLREGLSAGERTVLGNVVETDKPQGIGETLARTAFGLTPLGPIAALMGRNQLAIAPNLQGSKGVNYDPKLDPASPEYQGPKGLLGGIGSTIEALTFGGARPITKTGEGIIDLIQGQDAQKEMKDAVDQTGNNLQLDPRSNQDLQLVPNNQAQKISTDLKYVSPRVEKIKGEPKQDRLNEMMFDAAGLSSKYAFDMKEIDASDFQPGGPYSVMGKDRSGNYRLDRKPDGGFKLVDIGY